MFGWCKPREEFVSRLIGGQSYQFRENDIYEFHDLGDLYSVSSIFYYVQFTKETFYKKFRVINRKIEYFEKDCIVDILTYKKINSDKEESYLVSSLYIEKYYDWLNKLYDFKKDLAFQELIDFEDDKRVIDSKISKKIYVDLKKYHNEAKINDKNLKENYSFIRMYESLMSAFKFASNDGKVEFC